MQNDFFVNSVGTYTILFAAGVSRLQDPPKMHSQTLINTVFVLDTVMVLAGKEIIFFLVVGTVYFGFVVRIILITGFNHY